MTNLLGITAIPGKNRWRYKSHSLRARHVSAGTWKILSMDEKFDFRNCAIFIQVNHPWSEKTIEISHTDPQKWMARCCIYDQHHIGVQIVQLPDYSPSDGAGFSVCAVPM